MKGHRKEKREAREKFVADCEQSLIRILSTEAQRRPGITFTDLLKEVDDRKDLLKRHYPQRVGSIILAAENVKKAVNKLAMRG